MQSWLFSKRKHLQRFVKVIEQLLQWDFTFWVKRVIAISLTNIYLASVLYTVTNLDPKLRIDPWYNRKRPSTLMFTNSFQGYPTISIFMNATISFLNFHLIENHWICKNFLVKLDLKGRDIRVLWWGTFHPPSLRRQHRSC